MEQLESMEWVVSLKKQCDEFDRLLVENNYDIDLVFKIYEIENSKDEITPNIKNK